MTDAKKSVVAIAIDRSEHAENAFDWYVKSAHKKDNYVVLLNIPELNEAAHHSSMAFSPGVWNELWQKEQAQTRELQHQYEKKMQNANLHGKWCTIKYSGKPGEGLVKGAQEEKADYIVMGTRGQGSVRRTIMGSVSDYVLHHAHVPVFVCRLQQA